MRARFKAYEAANVIGEIRLTDGRVFDVNVVDAFPAAQAFGWSPGAVQCCEECGEIIGPDMRCHACRQWNERCGHDTTDGLTDCPCGVKVGEFRRAAVEWLRANDGLEVEIGDGHDADKWIGYTRYD